MRASSTVNGYESVKNKMSVITKSRLLAANMIRLQHEHDLSVVISSRVNQSTVFAGNCLGLYGLYAALFLYSNIIYIIITDSFAAAVTFLIPQSLSSCLRLTQCLSSQGLSLPSASVY